ncbi:hypothetical protein MCEGE10_02751 [Flavobacteriaceae bacterium]
MKQLFLSAALLVIGFSNAQVKIGGITTSMNAASLLELESTTQGLLPPRMTSTQMSSIGSPGTPPAGMQVWCTDCGTSGEMRVYNGTAWTVLSNGQVGGFTHFLGEAFNGGIIYYLYKGSDGLEHGLIIALTEQVTTKWQNTATLVNANRNEDGAYNTTLMTGSPAKNYIATLGSGWYLPSIDELGLLYYNRYSVQKGLRAGGNTLLSNTYVYWSSTEYDSSNAYYFGFDVGGGNNYSKLATAIVRGVRAF